MGKNEARETIALGPFQCPVDMPLAPSVRRLRDRPSDPSYVRLRPVTRFRENAIGKLLVGP